VECHKEGSIRDGGVARVALSGAVREGWVSEIVNSGCLKLRALVPGYYMNGFIRAFGSCILACF